jgi:hypothetical protein
VTFYTTPNTDNWSIAITKKNNIKMDIKEMMYEDMAGSIWLGIWVRGVVINAVSCFIKGRL